MKLIITDTYEEMSNYAAQTILSMMTTDKRVNLSLTAGSTPKGTYDALISHLNTTTALLENVHFYTFDGMPTVNKNKGTLDHLNDMLYDHIEIDRDFIHELTIDNIDEIRDSIYNSGGLDYMLVGLGDDGHFCGNMPYKTEFLSDIYTYRLSQNKDMPWYATYLSLVNEESELPDEVVTMGMPMLMKTKQLVLIVNGKNKASTFKRFIKSEITNEFPSSILKLHPNLTVIVDKDAASEL